ncbi:hypothetical protein C8J57DRAFT_1638800, partial [Mycena rebaudengoi]
CVVLPSPSSTPRRRPRRRPPPLLLPLPIHDAHPTIVIIILALLPSPLPQLPFAPFVLRAAPYQRPRPRPAADSRAAAPSHRTPTAPARHSRSLCAAPAQPASTSLPPRCTTPRTSPVATGSPTVFLCFRVHNTPHSLPRDPFHLDYINT